MLDLAGGCLTEPSLQQLAAATIMALCEAAALHWVRLPDGMVPSLLSLLDQNQNMEVDQNLAQALAHCLSAPASACSLPSDGRAQV